MTSTESLSNAAPCPNIPSPASALLGRSGTVALVCSSRQRRRQDANHGCQSARLVVEAVRVRVRAGHTLRTSSILGTKEHWQGRVRVATNLKASFSGHKLRRDSLLLQSCGNTVHDCRQNRKMRMPFSAARNYIAHPTASSSCPSRRRPPRPPPGCPRPRSGSVCSPS